MHWCSAKGLHRAGSGVLGELACWLLHDMTTLSWFEDKLC